MRRFTKIRLVAGIIALTAVGIYYCVGLYMPHPLWEHSPLKMILSVEVWEDGSKREVTEQVDLDALYRLMGQCEHRRTFLWERKNEEELLRSNPVEIRFIGDVGFSWRMFVGPEETAALDSKEHWRLISGDGALRQELAPLLE